MKFTITPELLTAILRVAANAYECYRDIASRNGMDEAEILAAWNEARSLNDRDLASFIADLGGTFTPEPSQE